MKHKYKTFRFVNGKQVCEWKEEEINPILYLNDYYNFLDTDTFENTYGHAKGSKNFTYEVLKKHLEALEIIKEKTLTINDLYWLKNGDYEGYRNGLEVLYSGVEEEHLQKILKTQEEYELLKEVLL